MTRLERCLSTNLLENTDQKRENPPPTVTGLCILLTMREGVATREPQSRMHAI